MSIRSFQYAIGAGESRVYTGGGYFSIEQLSSDVDLEFFDQQNNSMGVVQNIGAGFWADLNKFGSVKLTSALAQTVNILIGSKGQEFGVNKTSTTITGGVLDPLTLSETHYYRVNGSTSLVTHVTPAANVAGIKILKAFAGVHTTGGYTARVMAKESAPSTVGDSSALTIAMQRSGATTIIATDNNFDSIFIPVGFGLYSQSDDTATSIININYELL